MITFYADTIGETLAENLTEAANDVMAVTEAQTSASLSKTLADAGINTAICISVVFCVLIFISLVISLFSVIPKIQDAQAKRKAKKAEEAVIGEKAIEAAVSQIAAKEQEELMDDLELVAVIAAAIAASTGTSTDDFVVRSIRKVKRA